MNVNIIVEALLDSMPEPVLWETLDFLTRTRRRTFVFALNGRQVLTPRPYARAAVLWELAARAFGSTPCTKTAARQ